MTTLIGMGQDPATCHDAIERYARAADDAAYVRETWEAEGKPTKGFGDRGGEIPHPLLKAVRETEQHADKLAQGLGLTPDARGAYKQKPGRPKGSTSAPDRKAPSMVRRIA